MGAAYNNLSAKRRRFVDEYVIDMNATQAATRAGYSARTANRQGTRLLSNAVIAEAVGEKQRALEVRSEITQDKVIAELAKLGFSNMLDYVGVQDDGTAYVDLSKITRDQAAAISEVNVETYWEPGLGDDAAREVKKIRFKLADKRAPLELIGKHLGMFSKIVLAADPESPPVLNVTPSIELAHQIRDIMEEVGALNVERVGSGVPN